ncbi:response regulator [Phototrophicus methaneseepsis]|uniref:Response regulator n=1 Tax=Phototrophicus methaneseepsis TaxID=2710758 RepID=A0A7S8EDD6_9CHLR|nr:response regulator [Phototrophicus methaneseepsis]QPC84910.1 response regulator [Phototrophicus methaneseepsis]
MSKIMIVDDDHTTVSLLQTLLELDGYDVIVVAKGTEVVNTAEQRTPDAILMDYHLADTDGVTVLKALRAHPTIAHTPVIITSGMDVSDEVMAAGADAFLVKPFEPGELPELFRQYIGE